MSMSITDEVLMAYADGELDPGQRAEVDRYLAENPEARETLREFEQTALWVREAFDGPINDPVPQAILDSINISDESRLSWLDGVLDFLKSRAFGAGLATACVSMMIGLGGGMFLTEWRLDQTRDMLALNANRTENIIRQTLQQALETQRSGISVNWEDADGMTSGAVTPIRTFKNAKSQFCREFEVDLLFQEGARKSRGIACRQKDGKWKMTVRMYNGDRRFVENPQSL